MSTVIGEEAFFLWNAVILGAGLLCLYDLLRVGRRLIPHGKVWIALEDIGYWLFSGMMIFRMLYTHNRGIIRWFVIVGVLIGMLLYGWLFSELLLNGLTKVFRWIWKKIRRPVLFVGKKLQQLGRFLNRYGRKCTKLSNTLLHNIRKVCKMKIPEGKQRRSKRNGKKEKDNKISV